jgi:hypothetical protein
MALFNQISLYDEINGSLINFVDTLGNTTCMLDFSNPKFIISSEKTDWKEINLTHKKDRYYKKLAEIDGDYYVGDYNYNNYKNKMALIFKVNLPKKKFFGEAEKYIYMLIDNPFYDRNSNNYSSKGRYKLIVFKIIKYGMYTRVLIEDSIYTSSN